VLGAELSGDHFEATIPPAQRAPASSRTASALRTVARTLGRCLRSRESTAGRRASRTVSIWHRTGRRHVGTGKGFNVTAGALFPTCRAGSLPGYRIEVSS
jgi:hypothetical protein